MREGPDILENKDEKDTKIRTGLLYACKYGRYDIVRMMHE